MHKRENEKENDKEGMRKGGSRKTMSCRKMSSILGCIRSCLVALPCLQAFTDQFVHFVNLHKVKKGSFFSNSKRIKAANQGVQLVFEKWQRRPFVQKAKNFFAQ